MHGENEDKKLTVLAWAVFRTQPKVYGGAFLQKWFNDF